MQEARTGWVRNSQKKAKEVEHKHKKVLGVFYDYSIFQII